MESVLNSYSPLDLPAIEKQLAKQIKKINTDKDLEVEVADIMVTLKDLSK